VVKRFCLAIRGLWVSIFGLGTKKMSIAKPWKIQAAPETIARLSSMADELGGAMTANGIAAMVAFEVSKVPAKDLWLALGAVRQFSDAGGASPAAKRLPGGPLIQR
jgi:hypothetical protein